MKMGGEILKQKFVVLMVVIGILFPFVTMAGIPTVWSDVQTVKLAVGETRTFSAVDSGKLFRVIVPGASGMEQDKLYYQLLNRVPSSGTAWVKVYADSAMYVSDNGSQVSIDTQNALAYKIEDSGGSDYTHISNRSAGDSVYYINISQVTCTIAFSRARTFEVLYKPGVRANERSSVKDWSVWGGTLKLKGAIFTRDGYTQTGWALADGGGLAYALNSSYSRNVSLTLYPVWTQDVEHEFVIADGVLTQYNGAGGDVTIPEGVTSIGECAFEGRYDLTSVEIPSGVTNIDYLAFYFCDGLTSVAMPSSLTRIREGAFAFCEGLTSVTLPSSIAEIGVDAFANCSSLEVIYVSGNGDIDAVRKLLLESGLDVDQVIFDSAENPTRVYYRIAFKANGGKGSMPRRPVELGHVVKLPNCTFKPPSGKRFAGWACSNGRRYDDGMLVFNLAQPGETVTMTAIWE